MHLLYALFEWWIFDESKKKREGNKSIYLHSWVLNRWKTNKNKENIWIEWNWTGLKTNVQCTIEWCGPFISMDYYAFVSYIDCFIHLFFSCISVGLVNIMQEHRYNNTHTQNKTPYICGFVCNVHLNASTVPKTRMPWINRRRPKCISMKWVNTEFDLCVKQKRREKKRIRIDEIGKKNSYKWFTSE